MVIFVNTYGIADSQDLLMITGMGNWKKSELNLLMTIKLTA